MEIPEEEYIGYDALYDSMMRCKKGVLWKDSVAHFYLNAPEQVLKLHEELTDGSYQPRKPIQFTITSPKRREISSIPFRDRVYQRSLNDNVLYPIMTKSFIYDNWACQKGKGTDNARERLKEFMRWHFRKHGPNGYVLQLDIKGYYPNMDHQYIEQMFKEKLPEDVFERVKEILHHQYSGDTGYNPGSQLIQIAGISALDKVDHYIKEKLHMHCYLRYMDDLVMIHEDKAYLESCLERIKNRLAAGKFELNEKKSKIYPLSEGITFLGFTFFLSETGRVFMRVNPKNVKAKRKNLRRLVAKSMRGEIPRESVDESYRSWRDHAAKGNSYHLLQRMDAYYQQLWRDADVKNNKEKNPAGDRGNDQPPAG